MHHLAQSSWRTFKHVGKSHLTLWLLISSGPLCCWTVPSLTYFLQLFHGFSTFLKHPAPFPPSSLSSIFHFTKNIKTQKISSICFLQQCTYLPVPTPFLDPFFWWPWVAFSLHWLNAQNSILFNLLVDISPAISLLSLYLWSLSTGSFLAVYKLFAVVSSSLTVIFKFFSTEIP